MEDKTFEKIKSLIENGENIFITGGAGSGKSYLLHELKNFYQDSLQVTSTTGISAINVSGQTIHSWAGIGIGNRSVEETIKRILKNPILYRRLILCNMLAIDEISMLDAEMFDYISEVLINIRKIEKPFGGIQLLIFGDFFQLPPVQTQDEEKKEFCFNSKTWKDLKLKTILLEDIKRQSDKSLIEALNSIRCGNSDNLNLFYERDYTKQNLIVPNDVLRIFGTNLQADTFNKNCFNKINDKIYEYEAYDEFFIQSTLSGAVCYTTPNIENNENLSHYERALYSKFNEYCKAPQKLELKVGCRVMLLKNINLQDGLANGSCGTVVALGKSSIKIMFDNGLQGYIEPAEFEYQRNGTTKIRRSQYPLRLAYGITIHKSQGMTFDKLIVDFNKIFDYGQAYVALSRTRTLKGLYINNFDHKKIIANPEVVEFYKNLKEYQI